MEIGCHGHGLSGVSSHAEPCLLAKRQPWVYGLVGLCLAVAAFLSFGWAWFKISWPGAADDQTVAVGQWIGFTIVITLLGWFVLGKQSRRYYHVSAAGDADGER
jgi:multisubunit Na+/H+ antiporter MnhB subunit